MSAAVETTLELDVSLDEPLPCEHPSHGKDMRFHGGPGELYIKNLGCPKCGYKPREGFICCRKAWIVAGNGGLYCTECGYAGPRDEFWLLIREL